MGRDTPAHEANAAASSHDAWTTGRFGKAVVVVPPNGVRHVTPATASKALPSAFSVTALPSVSAVVLRPVSETNASNCWFVTSVASR